MPFQFSFMILDWQNLSHQYFDYATALKQDSSYNWKAKNHESTPDQQWTKLNSFLIYEQDLSMYAI
jgi:hypothetical protein